jgi:hypothetical protein
MNRPLLEMAVIFHAVAALGTTAGKPAITLALE